MYQQHEYKIQIINKEKKKKKYGGLIYVKHDTQAKMIVIVAIENKTK